MDKDKDQKPIRPSADPTRQKILKAAQKLFAKSGLAGTSISEIAAKAKINQSLIYHHFGSKQDLWKAVKANLLESYFKVNIEDILVPHEDFSVFLRNFITARFDFFDKNPDIRRMIIWQRLEQNQAELKSLNEKFFQSWKDIFNDFQQRGQVRKDLDSCLTLLFIMNATTSFFLDSKAIFPQKTAEEYEVMKQNYLAMIISSLDRAFSSN